MFDNSGVARAGGSLWSDTTRIVQTRFQRDPIISLELFHHNDFIPRDREHLLCNPCSHHKLPRDARLPRDRLMVGS